MSNEFTALLDQLLDGQSLTEADAAGWIGVPKWISTGRKMLGNGWSGGWIDRAPLMPTGTIGQPVRIDKRAAPVCPL